MAETKLTRQQYRRLTVLRDQPYEGITNIVADDILYQSDPLRWLTDLLHHGCACGMVPGMIYRHDTHAFFDRHYDEIEDMRREYEDSTGVPLPIRYDLKNDLAWFAYEETAYRIAEDLGLEY